MSVLNQFEQIFSDFSLATIPLLPSVYSESVVFRDPVHELHGLRNVSLYFGKTLRGVSECRFEFITRVVQADQAAYRWRMWYAHPKLQQGELLSLSGASFLSWQSFEHGERIIFHEDYYDLGDMIYQRIPILSSVIRVIKRRMAD